MHYTPPTPQDITELKERLNLSSADMAELFGVSSGRQMRKYMGGESPREMGPHMLAFAGMRSVLDERQIELVLEWMRQAGAHIDLVPDGEPQP